MSSEELLRRVVEGERNHDWMKKYEPEAYRDMERLVSLFYKWDCERCIICYKGYQKNDVELLGSGEFIAYLSLWYLRDIWRTFRDEVWLTMIMEEGDEFPCLFNIVWGFQLAFVNLFASSNSSFHFFQPHENVKGMYQTYISQHVKNVFPDDWEYEGELTGSILGLWHVLATVRRYPSWAKERVRILGKCYKRELTPVEKKRSSRSEQHLDRPINVSYYHTDRTARIIHPLENCDFTQRWHIAGTLLSCRTIFSQQEFDELCHILVHSDNLKRLALGIEKVRVQYIKQLVESWMTGEDELLSMNIDTFVQLLELRVGYPETYVRAVITAMEQNLDIPVPPVQKN
jgi:hypothetical protein